MAAPNVNGSLHLTGVHQKPPASFGLKIWWGKEKKEKEKQGGGEYLWDREGLGIRYKYLGKYIPLLEGESTRHMLSKEKGILVELCNILHRQLLTVENSGTQTAIMTVVALAATAAAEKLAADKKAKLNQIYPANQGSLEKFAF